MGDYEDPVVWYDGEMHKYRMLMHQYRAEAVVGGYAESLGDDFFGPWKYSYDYQGYGLNVMLKGGANITLKRRERPKVYLEHGVATLLYNGVCASNTNADCFTFVQKI